MLTALENELVDLVKASPLAGKLHVGTLPRVAPDVVERMAVQAPAIYIVWRDIRPDGNDGRVAYELLLLARNARGHDAARQGDGHTIGLYDMVDALLALLAGAGWRVTAATAVRGAGFEEKGIYAASMLVESDRTLPTEIDETRLATFLTFHADYDLAPADDAVDGQDDVTLPQ